MIKLGEKCFIVWVYIYCFPHFYLWPLSCVFEMLSYFWLNTNFYKWKCRVQMLFLFFQKGSIPLLGRWNDVTSPILSILSKIWTLTETNINFRCQLSSLRYSKLWNIETNFCLSRFLMLSNTEYLYMFRLSSLCAENFSYLLEAKT